MRRVHGNHGRYHRPPKYGDTSGGGEDPVSGMLWLPSASETNDQVLTRDSTSTHGIKWAAAGATVQNAPPFLELPLAMKDQSTQLEDSWDWTVDATYVNCGYLEKTTDGQVVSWMVNLQPARSAWIIGVITGMGADYGKLETQLASNPIDQSIFTADRFPEESANLTYVTLQTFDCYNATTLKNVQWASFTIFLITGDEGTNGTAFTTGTGLYAGIKTWDGGPGLHRVRLKTNGKHASSTGYRNRVSQLVVARVSDAWLF